MQQVLPSIHFRPILLRGVLIAFWSMSFVLSAWGQGIVDGFMKGAGQTDVVLSYSYESYSKYYAGTTAVENPNLGTIRTQSANLFVAGGITPFLDVVLNVPYVRVAPTEGYWPAQSGMQDISAALRLLAFRREFGKFGQLDLLISGGVRAPMTNYVPDAAVAIGHQSTQWESRVMLQHRHPSGIFAMAQGGYVRLSNVMIDRGYEVFVPDAYEGVFRLGYASSKVFVCGWLHRRDAWSGTDLGPGVPFPTNKIDVTRVGLDVAMPLPGLTRWAAVLGTGFTLNGRNVGHATRVSGGIIYHLPSWKGLAAAQP